MAKQVSVLLRALKKGLELNRVISRICQCLKQPMLPVVYIWGRLAPAWLFLCYSKKAHKQGVRRPYFILSFDCDTEKDIEVVEGVHKKILAMGIKPVYAVPGQLLEKGKDVYRSIAASGSEFINHGHVAHTHYDHVAKKYENSFFYNKLTWELIKDDIIAGHQACLSVLGKKPDGFRTPHFGTFQGKTQLKFIHDLLKKMRYSYSSSTMPLYGFLHGPVYKISNGFWEIPVSGSYNNPLSVLDSWSFRYAPNRRYNENDYVEQFKKLLMFFRQRNTGCLLNIYADPSQIFNWSMFFDCIKIVADFAAKSYISFLIEDIRCQGS